MNLDKLFNPRSVAIVGASANPAAIGGQPLDILIRKEFHGAIYPINPKYPEIAGYQCYASVAELPAAPDVAIIAVAATGVPDVLEALGERGTGAAVIFSSGFAEAGEEGRALQTRLAEIAHRHGITVIGPNCQGYMNISDGVHLGFGAPYYLGYPAGGVSLTSQSGAFGNSILMLASDEGVGFHRYISTGNESVTTSIDCFEAFIDDPGTEVIAAYVEGFRDARRLPEVARRCLQADKPMVVWKVGSSDAGARAAASHTANLGGAMALYRAAFRDAGIIEANDIGDLADCAKALQSRYRPRGNKVAVVTVSGGAGIAMADRAEQAGLQLPDLTDATLEALHARLPGFAAVGNPLDITAALMNDVALLEWVLDTLARDPGVDAIMLALAAAGGAESQTLAEKIVAVSEHHEMPVLVAWNAPAESNAGAYRVLRENRIPLYQSPVRCARGCGVLYDYAQARARLLNDGFEPAWTPDTQRRDRAAARLDSVADTSLSEWAAKKLLADYHIPVTRECLATSRDQVAGLAAELGFPLVMKIQSPDIPHKTEAGGVLIGIADEPAALQGYDRILEACRAHHPGANIEGVLLQEMLDRGHELIIGGLNDPIFGPAVMVGFGGIFAEVQRDVCFALAPLSEKQAERMVRSLRGFALLDGARGRPKADVDAVIRALVNVSHLIAELEDRIAELDINPLIVADRGQGAVAADAYIKLMEQPTGEQA